MRLRSTDPYAAPLIDMGYYTEQSDLLRMVEGVKEARRISNTAPLAGFVAEEIFPGPDVITDSEIAQAICNATRSYHHPVGTCAMGPANRTDAVVGGSGEVHGTDGLYGKPPPRAV